MTTSIGISWRNVMNNTSRIICSSASLFSFCDCFIIGASHINISLLSYSFIAPIELVIHRHTGYLDPVHSPHISAQQSVWASFANKILAYPNTHVWCPPNVQYRHARSHDYRRPGVVCAALSVRPTTETNSNRNRKTASQVRHSNQPQPNGDKMQT